MSAPHKSTRADDDTSADDSTRRTLDLSVTQVAAAALAAVTAALLGSGLGIAGTLIGAAGASVVLTVGTALYRASLERSQEKLRELARRTRASQLAGGRTTSAESPGAPARSREDRGQRVRMLRWGGAVMGGVGGFVLAMLLISGFEWVSGGTLGGHGEGTTVGQVVRGPSDPARPTVGPEPTGSDVPAPDEPSPSDVPDRTEDDSETATSTPPDDNAPEDEGEVSESDSVETSSPPTTTETETPQPLLPPLLPNPED